MGPTEATARATPELRTVTGTAKYATCKTSLVYPAKSNRNLRNPRMTTNQLLVKNCAKHVPSATPKSPSRCTKTQVRTKFNSPAANAHAANGSSSVARAR